MSCVLASREFTGHWAVGGCGGMMGTAAPWEPYQPPTFSSGPYSAIMTESAGVPSTANASSCSHAQHVQARQPRILEKSKSVPGHWGAVR